MISDLSKKTLRQAIDTLVAKQGFIIKGNGDGTVRFIRAPLADLGIRYLCNLAVNKHAKTH